MNQLPDDQFPDLGKAKDAPIVPPIIFPHAGGEVDVTIVPPFEYIPIGGEPAKPKAARGNGHDMEAASQTNGATSLAPNKSDMLAQLYALFDPDFVNDHPDALFEIALGNPATGAINDGKQFSAFKLEEAANYACSMNRGKFNIYVGPALRKAGTTGRACDLDITTASRAWADFDGPDDAARVSDLLRSQNIHPSEIVQTGTIPHRRFQIFVKLAPGTTRAGIEAANIALKTWLGGDDVENPSRPMRLAGGISYPKKDKRDRGYVTELVTLRVKDDAPAYKVEQLIALAPQGMVVPQDTPHTARTGDEIIDLLEASRSLGPDGKKRWHNSIRNAIASMIGRNWSDLQIRLACAPYCTGGADDPDLDPLITGGRRKFNHPEQPDAPDPTVLLLANHKAKAEPEDDDEDEAPPPKLADIPLPDIDWTRPEGRLGEMTDFVLTSSEWPNRPLAVASAIATLSPICGRWLYGPTGSSLGVYIVILAGTTIGKNRPLTAVYQMLRAAGLEKLHTTGKAFSISALEQLIANHPSVVATCDEIGASLFNRMANKNANSHAQDMKGGLLELWTRDQNMGPFSNTRRAVIAGLKMKAIVTVERPNFTLFGVSGPHRFWASIPPGSVQDGFLNRFLIFHADSRGTPQEVSEEATVVPKSIVRQLRAMVPVIGGDLANVLGIYDATTPLAHLESAVRRLPWGDDTVKARAHAFQKQVLHVTDNNPDEADLIGRVYEYAIRLASLHAVSREGPWAAVTLRDLEWGIVASVTSALNLIEGAGRLAETDYEERFNLIRDVIKKAKRIGQREILRKVRRINEQQRNEVTKHLRDGGWIKPTLIRTKGRTANGWEWIGGD